MKSSWSMTVQRMAPQRYWTDSALITTWSSSIRRTKAYLPAQSEVIGNYMGAYAEREFFPKSVYGEACELMFEGKPYKAPAKPDQYLRGLYGDYRQLPPPEEQVPKHHILRIEFTNQSN